MMSENQPLSNGRGLSDFFCHMVEMPTWHRRILILATILFGGGVVGQGAGYFSAAPARAVRQDATPNSSLVRVEQDTVTKQADPTITQKLSPHATKIGVSFIAAFVIGWLARAFVKIVTTVAGLAIAAAVALNHFGIVDIDLTGMRHEAAADAHSVISQVQHYATALIHLLPSSVAGGAGMWIGFRRR